METQKQIAKRQSGYRRIERSLKKCSALETERLVSIEKQVANKTAYRKEVAGRSTGNMLDKFRGTFSVEKKEDSKKRPSDKAFQIRLYTKVNRDYWDYEDLREWYNKTGQKPGHAGAGETPTKLDAVQNIFCVDRYDAAVPTLIAALCCMGGSRVCVCVCGASLSAGQVTPTRVA